MFHRFHREGTQPLGQGSITDVEFEAILKYVGLERILSPREWLARVRTGTLQGTDICITFDDGLRSQFEVALPVLNRLGLKSFWFIVSSVLNGNVDRNEIASYLASFIFSSFVEFAGRFEQHASLDGDRLSSKEFIEFSGRLKERFHFYSDADVRFRYIRNFLLSRNEFEAIVDRMIGEAGLTVTEIASRLWMTGDDILSLHEGGHAIGLHSLRHPFMLASLPLSEQEAEYKTNHQHLSAITGCPPESMSHPLNSYSRDTLEILKKLNITCGFCSNMSVPEGREFVNPSSLEFARVDSAELLTMI
ncbi:MAG TPA: polysaccharide deacetylase family protein [Bacteroidota bacterium]|nr:polysaccharide deacetylase family protein [Bacteroidota bacterium]